MDNKVKHSIADYEGLICEPVKDENGFYHVGECSLKLTHWQEGRKLKLVDVVINTNPQTNYFYQYFAKWEKL